MTKRCLVFFLLSVLLLSAACSFIPLGKAEPQIIKSNNDNREYRYVEFSNQLRVLLVSDVEAEKSAASLDQ